MSSPQIENELSTRLGELLSELDQQIKIFKETVSRVRVFKKEVKTLEHKLKKKTKRVSRPLPPGERRLTGFGRPVKISKELSKFLVQELPKILKTPAEDYMPTQTSAEKKKAAEYNEFNGVLLETIEKLNAKSDDNELARSDFSRLASRYIKFHHLQDPNSKKVIVMDKNKAGKTFKSLLKTNDDNVEITFINLQKYIQHHFQKKVVPEKVVPEKVVPEKVVPEKVPEKKTKKRGTVARGRTKKAVA